MRRAFIGVSGPIAYDYKNQSDRCHRLDGDAPNPILEDGLGLLVLYDELIFLCPQLCPTNMRSLPYVSFLSDDPRASERVVEAIRQFRELLEAARRNPFESGALVDPSLDPERTLRCGSDFFSVWNSTLGRMTGEDIGSGRSSTEEPTFIVDNHTHTFYIADDTWLVGNSANLENVLLDWWLAQAVELDDCDIVYNGPASAYYDYQCSMAGIGPVQACHPRSLTATDILVAKHMPAYISPTGPYHECIEDLRGHPFVEDYRRSINHLLREPKELVEAVTDLEHVANDYRDEVFLRHMRSYRSYTTYAKVFSEALAEAHAPGIGLLLGLIEQVHRARERRMMGWTGFIVDIPRVVT